MVGQKCSARLSELDEFVVAYEAAQERPGGAALADFLPPPAHRLYGPIVRELVRVDLEYGWRLGRPTPLDDYRQRFPDVFRDPDALEEIAFEEYRQRREAGENPTPAEYRQRYGVDAAGWPPPAPAAKP